MINDKGKYLDKKRIYNNNGKQHKTDSKRMDQGEYSNNNNRHAGSVMRKKAAKPHTSNSGKARKKDSYDNMGRNLHNNNRRKHAKGNTSQENFRIIPLGGLKEIGKNITLIEYKDEILIIDCGFSFPEDEMFGIDVVIPDFTYLKENAGKIKGLIITHGHEDHIGGVPYLLQVVDVPIYASPLTIGLITNKLKEFNLNANLNLINADDVLHIGSFTVEAIRTNHSIADSFAYSIKFPAGHVLHTGDFKVDFSPLDGRRIDLNKFAKLGDEGVDVMLCDSTNVLRQGYTPSEKIVVDSMNKIFDQTDKRIIIATFSSNIYRIKHFMEASLKHGRKIAVSGRSMESVIGIARELGYLDIPESAFVDIRRIGNIPDGNLTIVTTGSQGEPMSALTRMANDNHKTVKLKKGDVVIFSSSPIPGNEKTVTNVVNKLYEKNVTVFLSDIIDIHVSGHACQEELKLIHTLVKPRFFIPAHGEYRHLVEHAKLAISLGMNNGNVFVMNNGDALVVQNKLARLEQGRAEAEDVLVDGYGVGDVGSVVLRDRKQLSEAGLIVMAVSIDKGSGMPVSPPELATRGFIYVKENTSLIEEAKDVMYHTLDSCRIKTHSDTNALRNALRDDMRYFIYKKTRRNPVIIPIIMYV